MEQTLQRLQEGQLIHNIYCPTAEETIAVCEAELAMLQDEKRFYFEVPLEQFDQVFQYFNEMGSIKQGAFTYIQARHIAETGNIRNLKIDERGRIFFEKELIGISTALAFAQSKWNGSSREEAMEIAVMTGLAVIGEAFVEDLISVHDIEVYEGRKLHVGDGLEDVVRTNGAKVIVKKVAAKATKKAMYSSVVAKKTITLLNANVVTGALVTGVMSSIDIVRTIKGEMSPAQLFKNVSKTAASVMGSMIGLLIGGGIGLNIPNVSTAVISLIGGIVGLIIGSMLATKIVKRVLDFFIKDDTAKMLDIFNKQLAIAAEEFLLNEQELQQALSNFSEDYDMQDELRKMHASDHREGYANSLIEHELIRIVRARMYLQVPTNEELYQVIRRMQ
ncbi:hypothetical protein [Lysinibacillus sp. 3P01SB]|uniref:hypothetical protein n=1 Tax=Lysinibacillus sp. 3P01SB TaxID=3132284 RepID=UPI0039A50143